MLLWFWSSQKKAEITGALGWQQHGHRRLDHSSSTWNWFPIPLVNVHPQGWQSLRLFNSSFWVAWFQHIHELGKVGCWFSTLRNQLLICRWLLLLAVRKPLHLPLTILKHWPSHGCGSQPWRGHIMAWPDCKPSFVPAEVIIIGHCAIIIYTTDDWPGE